MRPRTKNKHLPPLVYPAGKKYRAQINGKTVAKFDTVSEAWAWHEENCQPTDLRLIRDLVTRYCGQEVSSLSKSQQANWVTYKKRIRQHLGHIPVAALRPHHVYKVRDIYRETPKAADNLIAAIGSLMVKAVEWGCRDDNPVKQVKKFGGSRSDVYVTDKQFNKAKEQLPPMYRAMLDFAHLTGLRRGDILKLTRDEVTDEGIVCRTSKTGAYLLIEWSDDLREVVRNAQQIKPRVRRYLFCNRKGEQIKASTFNSQWRRLKEKMGADHFEFRAIRPKSASEDTLEAAQARLGHSSPEITDKIYRRLPRKVRPLR